MFEYMPSIFCTGRSPYGERGLKFALLVDVLRGLVALLTESVD